MAIQIECSFAATAERRELVTHGSAMFPLACYEEDTTAYPVPWHWHDDLEYIHAHKGTLTLGISGERVHIEQGQGVFINAGVLHEVVQSDAPVALLRSVVFHPRLVGGMDTLFWSRFVQPFLEAGAAPCIMLDGSESWHGPCQAAFAAAWRAAAYEKPGFENEARYRLTAALELLCSQAPQTARHTSDAAQAAAERMKLMLSFIADHYTEELTVGQIAACAALSESACLRSFRQLLGTTPIQYVKQYRVEQAAALLRSTGLKTGEVGAMCGFADGSYFIRTFRAIKGCTPREYRAAFASAT